jgi:hypothetical protein
MSAWRYLSLTSVALMASGCVNGFHENAALRAERPSPPPAELSAYIAPRNDFPTVGGDILRGTSPADLAAAREAAVKPLAPDPGPGGDSPN